jgi:hypothetical protein
LKILFLISNCIIRRWCDEYSTSSSTNRAEIIYFSGVCNFS